MRNMIAAFVGETREKKKEKKRTKKRRGQLGGFWVVCGRAVFFCKGDGRGFAAPAMINFSLAITRSIGGFSELGRYKGTFATLESWSAEGR